MRRDQDRNRAAAGGLPLYMSSGQCSDARVQADNEMLEALTQVTEWRRRGDGVVLIGATQMPFRASSH